MHTGLWCHILLFNVTLFFIILYIKWLLYSTSIEAVHVLWPNRKCLQRYKYARRRILSVMLNLSVRINKWIYICVVRIKNKLQKLIKVYVVRTYVYNTCSTASLQFNIVKMAISYYSRTLLCFVHFTSGGNYNILVFNAGMRWVWKVEGKKEWRRDFETAWRTLVSLVGQYFWVSEKRKKNNISEECLSVLQLDTLSELVTFNT
jgi:hypothetical protein